MISSGFFNVTKEHLEKLGKEDGMEFLGEMLNYGGRIGHYEYSCWIKKMGWTLLEVK